MIFGEKWSKISVFALKFTKKIDPKNLQRKFFSIFLRICKRNWSLEIYKENFFIFRSRNLQRKWSPEDLQRKFFKFSGNLSIFDDFFVVFLTIFGHFWSKMGPKIDFFGQKDKGRARSFWKFREKKNRKIDKGRARGQKMVPVYDETKNRVF